jgi:hypothetical protein
MNSSHAIPAQIGYAILLGWLLHRVYAHACVRRRPWRKAAVAGFIGLGIFFNNANIDMFLDSWRQQIVFWKAFHERFPTLPEKAIFFFDTNDGTLYSDLRDYYGLEYQLNLLYAISDSPSEFRKYKVYTIAELTETRGKTPHDLVQSSTIERTTHLGKDYLKPSEFIVIHYRDGNLRVNNEILECCPDVPYKNWLNQEAPKFSGHRGPYIFRSRMTGFSS